MIAADRVGDVAAGGVEQERAGLDLGHGSEQVVEVVDRHGEDAVGLANEAGGDPAAAMVFERSAECPDDVDGVGGGGDAVRGRHTGGADHETAALELVDRATQPSRQQQFADRLGHRDCGRCCPCRRRG